MEDLIFWNEAKKMVHDASGLEYPEMWLWKQYNNVYYPVVITIHSN